MNLSIETCVAVLQTAIINRRTAFQMELAVGLGVFVSQDGTGREARRLLNQVYSSAGYDCLGVHGMDYKTVNRRINATAMLYEKVNARKWVGKLDEQDALKAIFVALQPYELHVATDVMRLCAPPPPTQAAARLGVAAHTSILSPAGTSGQDGIMQMFKRRAGDVEGDTLTTEHLALTVPKDATKAELVEMAQKLLEIAQRNGKLLTA